MDEVYRGPIYVWYSQIGILDSESSDRYSIDSATEVSAGWISPDYVIVMAENDTEVEASVVRGPAVVSGRLILQSIMTVGSQGIDIGSPPDSYINVSWNPGRVNVLVYAEGPEWQPTHLTFVLQNIEPSDSSSASLIADVE